MEAARYVTPTVPLVDQRTEESLRLCTGMERYHFDVSMYYRTQNYGQLLRNTQGGLVNQDWPRLNSINFVCGAPVAVAKDYDWAHPVSYQETEICCCCCLQLLTARVSAQIHYHALRLQDLQKAQPEYPPAPPPAPVAPGMPDLTQHLGQVEDALGKGSRNASIKDI